MSFRIIRMKTFFILMNKSANFFCFVLYTDEMVYSFAVSLLLLGCSF